MDKYGFMMPRICYCKRECTEYVRTGLCIQYQRQQCIHVVNFGNLPPLPQGYTVEWHYASEAYWWVLRNEQGERAAEGHQSWNRYWCRRCAIAHYVRRSSSDLYDHRGPW